MTTFHLYSWVAEVDKWLSVRQGVEGEMLASLERMKSEARKQRWPTFAALVSASDVPPEESPSELGVRVWDFSVPDPADQVAVIEAAQEYLRTAQRYVAQGRDELMESDLSPLMPTQDAYLMGALTNSVLSSLEEIHEILDRAREQGFRLRRREGIQP